MDGLNYVCRSCKEFTELQRNGFLNIDGEYEELDALTKCCDAEYFNFPDEDIEGFQEELKLPFKQSEFNEEQSALYSALQEDI